jgi:predicted transposase YdaD
MAEEDLHQPHDKLFKEGFSDPANAAALLRQHLPAEVSALIQWDQLKLIPGSFLDDDLRHSHSDLLFSAPLAADPESSVCVHLLFEHQSTRDPFIALRLLRYMVRIWEEWIRLFGNSKPLPVIVPVVLAQDRKVWNLNNQFSSLFGNTTALDSLRPFLPDFAFRLIQLAAIPFDAIRGTPDGIFVLRVLKAEPIGLLLGNAVWDNNLLAHVSRRLFDRFISFLFARADPIDRPQFIRKIHGVRNPALRTSAMTLAQQLRQEGRQEGIQEGFKTGELKGREDGRNEGTLAASRQSVLEALDLRFGPIPDGLRDSIEAISDPERLRALLRAAIVSDSLEAFTASL